MRIERVRRDGPLGDARWRRLAEHIGLTRDDRTLALRYDQRLALPCRRGPIVDIDR